MLWSKCTPVPHETAITRSARTQIYIMNQKEKTNLFLFSVWPVLTWWGPDSQISMWIGTYLGQIFSFLSGLAPPVGAVYIWIRTIIGGKGLHLWPLLLIEKGDQDLSSQLVQPVQTWHSIETLKKTQMRSCMVKKIKVPCMTLGPVRVLCQQLDCSLFVTYMTLWLTLS